MSIILLYISDGCILDMYVVQENRHMEQIIPLAEESNEEVPTKTPTFDMYDAYVNNEHYDSMYLKRTSSRFI